jgi:hypothetical protein
MKRLPLLLLLAALFAPSAAEEVVIGEMDEPCVLPFCGG